MLVIVTTDPPETQAWIRQRLEAEFIAALVAFPHPRPPMVWPMPEHQKETAHG